MSKKKKKVSVMTPINSTHRREGGQTDLKVGLKRLKIK